MDTWEEWLLPELRARYLLLCGRDVLLHEVHSSIYELDACYDPGRTYGCCSDRLAPRHS